MLSRASGSLELLERKASQFNPDRTILLELLMQLRGEWGRQLTHVLWDSISSSRYHNKVKVEGSVRGM